MGFMSTAKSPISKSCGPSREPAPGKPVNSIALSVDHCPPFDFRSGQFGDDAQTLARTTGRSLETCRQELYIAEGDLALAYELLTAGYQGEMPAPTLH